MRLRATLSRRERLHDTVKVSRSSIRRSRHTARFGQSLATLPGDYGAEDTVKLSHCGKNLYVKISTGSYVSFVRENISRPFISHLGFKFTGDDADPPQKKAKGADRGT